MMIAAAAWRQITLASVNLWQTGVRSLFRFFMYRAELTQDEAWTAVREELSKNVPSTTQEWEYQQIRAVLYEEENLSIEAARELYNRYPEKTPLLDAIKTCLQNSDKYRVDR